MSNRLPVKFDYAILCDDIRKEDNQKLLLIGIYTGDILVPRFPVRLGLSTMLHGFAQEEGELQIEFRYKVEYAKAKPHKVQGTGTVNFRNLSSSGEITVPLKPAMIEVMKPGQISFSYKFKSSRWKTLLTKSIKLFET